MPIELSRIEKGVLLWVEWVLLFALSLLFSRWGGTVWHQLWTLIGLGVILAGGIFILNVRLKQTKMGVYFALSVGTVLLSWLVFSWPVMLSFGFVLYFMWRLFQFIEGRTNEQRWWLWLITMGLILALLLEFHSWAMHLEVLLIACLQTLLILSVEMVQEWRLSKKVTGSLTVFLGFLGVLAIGFLVSLAVPFIKWILSLLLNVILFVVLYVAKFLWMIMSRILGPRAQAHKSILNNLFKNMKTTKQPIHSVSGHGFNPEALLGLVIVVLLIVTFLILRRLRFSNTRSESASLFETAAAVALPPKRSISRFFDSTKAPLDPVRAAVFNLQKKTRKSSYARKKYETLREWLERLSERPDLRQHVQTVYEQVRYGRLKSVSNLTRDDFENAIKRVVSDLNQKDQK